MSQGFCAVVAPGDPFTLSASTGSAARVYLRCDATIVWSDLVHTDLYLVKQYTARSHYTDMFGKQPQDIDSSNRVWLLLAVQNSTTGVLVYESDQAIIDTLLGSGATWAILARIEGPFITRVPQVAIVPPTALDDVVTTLHIRSTPGVGVIYNLGVDSGPPFGPPTGWTLPAYNDSGWGTARGNATEPLKCLPGCPWITWFPGGGVSAGNNWLHRRSFPISGGTVTSATLTVRADNLAIAIYLGGHLVGGQDKDSKGSSTIYHIHADQLNPAATNVLAIWVRDTASTSTNNCTALSYDLALTLDSLPGSRRKGDSLQHTGASANTDIFSAADLSWASDLNAEAASRTPALHMSSDLFAVWVRTENVTFRDTVNHNPLGVMASGGGLRIWSDQAAGVTGTIDFLVNNSNYAGIVAVAVKGGNNDEALVNAIQDSKWCTDPPHYNGVLLSNYLTWIASMGPPTGGGYKNVHIKCTPNVAKFLRTYPQAKWIVNESSQCVAVANAWCHLLGIPIIPCDFAKELYANAATGWDQIPESSVGDGIYPQSGDLVIWDDGAGSPASAGGHVALCLEPGNAKSFLCLDQGWTNPLSASKGEYKSGVWEITHTSYAHVTGWVRYVGLLG